MKTPSTGSPSRKSLPLAQPIPEKAKPASTLASLVKIPTVPGLYRHTENGSYYGKKKLPGGAKKVKALTLANGANITDRKTAEIALAAWVKSLTAPAPVASEMTLGNLWGKFEAAKAGLEENTRLKFDWAKKKVEADTLWAIRVTDIRPSHIAEFLAGHKGKMAASSFNSLSAILNNVLDIAVSDGLLDFNPWGRIPKSDRRKKNSSKPDVVPTIPECEAIVAHVRAQQYADTASASADMLEYMHKAALGTAECVNAEWHHMDWANDIIKVERQKTGEYFEIPMYPHLKPFLLKLWERAGKPQVGFLFNILNPKKALYAACHRLGLPAFSPRDLRKARIVWFIQKGMDVETIAAWQGHRDNGVLIRRTYANVINDSVKAHRAAQLAKLTES